jgi:hypothetical protein
VIRLIFSLRLAEIASMIVLFLGSQTIYTNMLNNNYTTADLR